MRLFTCCSLLILVGILFACAHPPAAAPAASCSNDPYLSKYGCSFSRIQTAALAGDPDAQYALGYMYYYGINTPRDTDAANVWIARAASQGQPLAKQAVLIMTTTESQAISIPMSNALPNYGKQALQSPSVINVLNRSSTAGSQ